VTKSEFPRTFDIQSDSFLAAGHNRVSAGVVEDNSRAGLDTGRVGETAAALVVGSSPRLTRSLRLILAYLYSFVKCHLSTIFLSAFWSHGFSRNPDFP